MRKSLVIFTLIAAVLTLGFTSQETFAQGWVTGVIYDGDGEPVEGAIVSIHSAARVRGQRPYRNRTETDGDGAFHFRGVPEGRYILTAGARGVGAARVSIGVRDGEGTRVRLQLRNHDRRERGDRETGQVVGNVINADEEAVAGANVVLTPVRRGRRAPRHRGFRVRTDRQGNFSFGEVPVGNYVIFAGARGVGIARARVEVEADGVVRIQLQLQGRE